MLEGPGLLGWPTLADFYKIVPLTVLKWDPASVVHGALRNALAFKMLGWKSKDRGSILVPAAGHLEQPSRSHYGSSVLLCGGGMLQLPLRHLLRL